MMTPEEFKEKMQELERVSIRDAEEAHVRADPILVELLEELGYAEGCRHFKLMTKYYS